MSEFKKGDAVQARTLRGQDYVKGHVAEVHQTQSGEWVEVQPEDKSWKPFRTRPSLVIKTLV